MPTRSLLILSGVAAMALAAASSASAGGCPAGHAAMSGHTGHVQFSRHAMHRGDTAMRTGWTRHWRGHRGQAGWVEFAGRGGLAGGRSSHWSSGLYERSERSFHEDHGWAMADGGVWAEGGYERHMTVDRFGYLDWPGKAHFVRDAGPPPPATAGEPAEGPNVGEPPLPPPPPPPPGDQDYEIRRF